MNVFSTPPNIDKLRVIVPAKDVTLDFLRKGNFKKVKLEKNELSRVHLGFLEVQYLPLKRCFCFEFSPTKLMYGNNMIPFQYGLSVQYEEKIWKILQDTPIKQCLQNSLLANCKITWLDLNYDLVIETPQELKMLLEWSRKLTLPRMQKDYKSNGNTIAYNKSRSFTCYDKRSSCRITQQKFNCEQEVMRMEHKFKSPTLKTKRSKGLSLTFGECLDNPKIAQSLWNDATKSLYLFPNILTPQEMEIFVTSLKLSRTRTNTLNALIEDIEKSGLDAVKGCPKSKFYNYCHFFKENQITPIPWNGGKISLFH